MPFGARYSQLRKICDILNDLNDDTPRVCLVTGVGGSGSLQWLTRLLDCSMGKSGGALRIALDVARQNPQNPFNTIARNLAHQDLQYKSALWDVVKDDRVLRRSTSPIEQVERLIIEPRKHLHTIGPLVIVIDALTKAGIEPVAPSEPSRCKSLQPSFPHHCSSGK